jgi:hypothetical protein
MYQVSITKPVVTIRLCHHAASLTTIKKKEIARETKKKEEHNKDQTKKKPNKEHEKAKTTQRTLRT